MPGTALRPLAQTSAGRRTTAWLLALLVSLISVQLVAAAPARAADAVPQMYQDQTFPTAGPAPTEDKPLSKLWYADGSWWALMRSSGGPITIHKLVSHAWRDTGTVVDDRASSSGDALWQGGKLYIASRTAAGDVEVIRLSYAAASDTYTVDAGFPTTVASGGSESVTIARDSTARLWITYTQGSKVLVAHTTTSDAAWTAPFPLPVPDNTLKSDDISAILAFSGRVGVMWSDQQTAVMRFAVHVDTAPDSSWTVETPVSGTRSADDHINLKSVLEDDGRIYAAVKTSRGDSSTDAATDPGLTVLTRSAGGTWTNTVVTTVGDNLTRPQLVLDSTNRDLYVVMTTEAGGSAYYKRSPLGANLAFPSGKGTPLISFSGAKINNAATSKDPVNATTGLVVLASDIKSTMRYYHAELALGAAPTPADTTAPSAPSGVSATASSPTTVDLRWTASTDAVGVASYQVKRGSTVVADAVTGTSFTDTGLSAGTAYSYTVSAVDAAGNRSSASAPATASTPTTPPPSSPGTGVAVDALSGGTTGTTNATSMSWTHTTATGAGLLLVTVETTDASGGRAVTALTYAGRPLALVPGSSARSGTRGTDRHVEVWSMTSPPAGTGTVTVTVNGGTALMTGESVTFSGVDTTAPLGTATAKAGSAANPTVSVTSAAGGAVLTAVATRSGAATPPPGSLAARADLAGTVVYGAAAVLPGASTVSAAWTAPSGSYAVAAVPIRASTSTPTPADTTAPSAPSGVSATASSPTTVDLRWTASTDAVGVASYQVKRGSTVVADAVTGTSFTDTGLSAGTAYSYTVSAVDAAGNRSSASAPATASTPTTPPPSSPGTGVAVDALSGGTTGTTNATSMSWTHTTATGAGLLLVTVETTDASGGRAVTALTYAGRPLALVPGSSARSGTRGTDRHVEVWSMTSPPAGTGTVTVTVNGGTALMTGESVTFSGVDTTAPLGTATAKAGSAANPTVSVTSAAGGAVLTAVATRSGAATPPPGSLAARADLAGTVVYGAAAVLPGASTVSAAWTAPSGSYAVAAVPIRASTSTPTPAGADG